MHHLRVGGAAHLRRLQRLGQQHAPRLPRLRFLHLRLALPQRLLQWHQPRLVRDAQQLLVTRVAPRVLLGERSRGRVGLGQLELVVGDDELLIEKLRLLRGRVELLAQARRIGEVREALCARLLQRRLGRAQPLLLGRECGEGGGELGALGGVLLCQARVGLLCAGQLRGVHRQLVVERAHLRARRRHLCVRVLEARGARVDLHHRQLELLLERRHLRVRILLRALRAARGMTRRRGRVLQVGRLGAQGGGLALQRTQHLVT
mmetsp:Transcript_23300/g.62488  ORF Transcript_23300/g.62488 Transcript_23300/m.62488 type:complete len:262 (-) Transcript_23300:142-927(-)